MGYLIFLWDFNIVYDQIRRMISIRNKLDARCYPSKQTQSRRGFRFMSLHVPPQESASWNRYEPLISLFSSTQVYIVCMEEILHHLGWLKLKQKQWIPISRPSTVVSHRISVCPDTK